MEARTGQAASTPARGEPEFGLQVVDIGTASDGHLATWTLEDDRLAMGMLYLRHQEAAWRVACVTTGFSADAEVALIEGFTGLFDSLVPPVPPEFPIRLRLFASVRRVALDRVGHRRPAGTPGGGDGEEPATGLEPNPVRRALCLLPECWRTTLWLSTVEALTPGEISPVVGVPASAVPSTTRQAWSRLRDECPIPWGPAGGHALLLSALDPAPLLGGEIQRHWRHLIREGGDGVESGARTVPLAAATEGCGTARWSRRRAGRRRLALQAGLAAAVAVTLGVLGGRGWDAGGQRAELATGGLPGVAAPGAEPRPVSPPAATPAAGPPEAEPVVPVTGGNGGVEVVAQAAVLPVAGAAPPVSEELAAPSEFLGQGRGLGNMKEPHAAERRARPATGSKHPPRPVRSG